MSHRGEVDGALHQHMQTTGEIHRQLAQQMTDAHAALMQRLDRLDSQVKTIHETLLPTPDERIQRQIAPLAEQAKQRV